MAGKTKVKTKVVVRREHGAVKLAHSLSEAVGTLSEHGMRLAVYACAEAVRTESRDLSIRVAHVAEEAGGNEDEMYAWAKNASMELGIRYLLQDEEGKGFVHVDLISGRVEYRRGVLSLSLGEDTYRELIEQRSYHTLAHLGNMRRIGRGRSRLALYLLLAAWDATGELVLSPGSQQLAGITKRKNVPPHRLYAEYLKPAAAHISERLGVEISSETVGRGHKARFVFRWPPNALRVAAGDPVELKLPMSKDEIIHSSTCAKLRMSGVWDPGIGRKLAVLPSVEAARVVDEAIGQGLAGRALHDRIMSAVGTWLLDGDRRASRAAARTSEDAAEEAAFVQRAHVAALAAEAVPGGPRQAEYEAWLAEQDEFLQGLPDDQRREAWAQEQAAEADVGLPS